MALSKISRERLTIIKNRILAEKLPVIMDNFFSVESKDLKRWKKYNGDPDEDDSYHGIEPMDGMTRFPDNKGKGQFGCKTAGCIAGHAIMEFMGGVTFETLLKDPKNKKVKSDEKLAWWSDEDDKDADDNFIEVSFERVAMKILGITEQQANDLFYPVYWPEFFKNKYNDFIEDHAFLAANKVVAARIQWFLDLEE